MSLPASTPLVSLILVGEHAELRSVLIAAQRAAFSYAKVETAQTVEEAIAQRTPSGNTLLALLASDAARLAAAAGAMDEHGLPRWGVIAFGDSATDPAGVVRVPPGNCNPTALAQILSLALELHRFSRENQRCRGDLSTLGTRVVHDLRSPLGGVLSTVEVLKEVLVEDAPDRALLLDPILDSTDGLTKLIRQISVVTKASGQGGASEPFNMGVAFWAAFQRIERDALSLGATIVQPASWPEVEGNSGWVETIWHALLANSLQHAGPKPRIEAGWNRGVGENRFWIIDNGQVPLEKRSMLFRPFHLLHHPNAPRGFGLPIVQRLAELQGGHTGYEPQPGGGSCFFFTLPLVAATTQANPPQRG